MVYVEVIPNAAPGVMMLRSRATDTARDVYEAVAIHRNVSATAHSWHAALYALENTR